MAEKRKHVRIPVKAEIEIEHSSFGVAIVETRDLSDGGVFLVIDGLPTPPLGTVLEGQVQGPASDLPVVQMMLVRVESEGWGVMFC